MSLLDAELGVDLRPGGADHRLVLLLHLFGGSHLGFEAFQAGGELILAVHENEHALLTVALLVLQHLDLPPQVVGIPGAQPTGVEPVLLGGHPRLVEVELAGDPVEVE